MTEQKETGKISTNWTRQPACTTGGDILSFDQQVYPVLLESKRSLGRVPLVNIIQEIFLSLGTLEMKRIRNNFFETLLFTESKVLSLF